MKFSWEDFKATFKSWTGKEPKSTAEEPELTAEDIQAMNDAVTERDNLKSQVETLKAEAQTAATNISELEAAAQTAKDEKQAIEAKVETLASTLAKYNVKVAEGENALDVANTTLEAWAKRSGLATGAASSTADDLNDGTPSFHSQTDEDVKAARARLNM